LKEDCFFKRSSFENQLCRECCLCIVHISNKKADATSFQGVWYAGTGIFGLYNELFSPGM
jgi:hypothetical protein